MSRDRHPPPSPGRPPPADGPSAIDDALFELLNTRCDVVLSAAGAGGMPSLCWGNAGRVHADRRTVEAWVREDQARRLLADIRETGRVAVVFNEPFTNIAVQFKGGPVDVRPATPQDEPVLQRHLENMHREMRRVGQTDAFARTFFEQPWSVLAVVRFVATQMFVQTPGPRAGQPLGPPAGGRDAG